MKNPGLLLLLIFSSVISNAQHFAAESPSGNIRLDIQNDSLLTYSVTLNGKQLIASSPMGFVFKNEPDMKGNFGLIDEVKRVTGVERWTPVVRNRHAECCVPYNEITLNLKEKSDRFRRMDLTFRIMDDAVAFRYTLYGNMIVGNREILKELTGYAVPENSYLWVPEFTYIGKNGYTSSQEGQFKKTPIKEISCKIHSGLPGLIKIDDDNWMAVLEANIDNYPGMYLGNSGKTKDGFTLIESKLAPIFGEDENGVKARFFEEFNTPWRVVMIGHNPGKFLESEVLRSLNPQCALDDVSWIKPGMSAWDHWWCGGVKMEMPIIKEYIDFASKEGWPYALIDWTWYGQYCRPDANVSKPAEQIDIHELIKYAKDRNVGLWVWMRSEDVNNNDQYKDAFKLYHEWGVKGVKIDFMDRDDQDMVNWYRRVIKEAADNQLMVDFHGAYKPDGIERTYPNMLTREGVMGSEYYKFGSDKMTPEHNVTLAYTRLLAGQMDYTPGGFLNASEKSFRQEVPVQVKNTRAQELAKFVVYESPYMVFCDNPKNVYGQIGEDFVSKVPTTWDDVKFLGGTPETYVALARKSGDRWYIGVLNNSESREIKIDLSELFSGKCSVESWSDGRKTEIDAKDCRHSENLSSKNILIVKLASAGGYAAIVTPIM